MFIFVASVRLIIKFFITLKFLEIQKIMYIYKYN